MGRGWSKDKFYASGHNLLYICTLLTHTLLSDKLFSRFTDRMHQVFHHGIHLSVQSAHDPGSPTARGQVVACNKPSFCPWPPACLQCPLYT